MLPAQTLNPNDEHDATQKIASTVVEKTEPAANVDPPSLAKLLASCDEYANLNPHAEASLQAKEDEILALFSTLGEALPATLAGDPNPIVENVLIKIIDRARIKFTQPLNFSILQSEDTKFKTTLAEAERFLMRFTTSFIKPEIDPNFRMARIHAILFALRLINLINSQHAKIQNDDPPFQNFLNQHRGFIYLHCILKLYQREPNDPCTPDLLHTYNLKLHINANGCQAENPTQNWLICYLDFKMLISLCLLINNKEMLQTPYRTKFDDTEKTFIDHAFPAIWSVFKKHLLYLFQLQRQDEAESEHILIHELLSGISHNDFPFGQMPQLLFNIIRLSKELSEKNNNPAIKRFYDVYIKQANELLNRPHFAMRTYTPKFLYQSIDAIEFSPIEANEKILAEHELLWYCRAPIHKIPYLDYLIIFQHHYHHYLNKDTNAFHQFLSTHQDFLSKLLWYIHLSQDDRHKELADARINSFYTALANLIHTINACIRRMDESTPANILLKTNYLSMSTLTHQILIELINYFIAHVEGSEAVKKNLEPVKTNLRENQRLYNLLRERKLAQLNPPEAHSTTAEEDAQYQQRLAEFLQSLPESASPPKKSKPLAPYADPTDTQEDDISPVDYFERLYQKKMLPTLNEDVQTFITSTTAFRNATDFDQTLQQLEGRAKACNALDHWFSLYLKAASFYHQKAQHHRYANFRTTQITADGWEFGEPTYVTQAEKQINLSIQYAQRVIDFFAQACAITSKNISPQKNEFLIHLVKNARHIIESLDKDTAQLVTDIKSRQQFFRTVSLASEKHASTSSTVFSEAKPKLPETQWLESHLTFETDPRIQQLTRQLEEAIASSSMQLNFVTDSGAHHHDPHEENHPHHASMNP